MERTSRTHATDAVTPVGTPPFQAVVDAAHEPQHGLRITGGRRRGDRHGARVALRGLLARLHGDRVA